MKTLRSVLKRNYLNTHYKYSAIEKDIDILAKRYFIYGVVSTMAVVWGVWLLKDLRFNDVLNWVQLGLIHLQQQLND